MPTTQSDRIDGLSTSVAIKPPCLYTTTGDIALSGLAVQANGEWAAALEAGDRIFVRDQSNSINNGIFLASERGWSRARDFDGARDAVQGTLISVYGGPSGGTLWKVSTPNPVVIGTSPLTFELSNSLLDLNKVERLVSTIAQLRALDSSEIMRAFVSGYHAAGDGGGGHYWQDASDTASADNGGTIIVAGDGARWKLGHDGTVTPEQFGALGDMVTDDTAALQTLLDWCGAEVADGRPAPHIYAPRRYLVSDTLTAVYDGFSLSGAGAMNSYLYRTGNFGDTLVIGRANALDDFPNFLQHAAISDFGFQTNGDVTNGAHVVFNRCLHFTFARCSVYDQFGGIKIVGGAWGYFSDFEVFTNRYWAAPKATSYCMLFETVAVPNSPFGNGRDRVASMFLSNFECAGWFANGYLDYSVVVHGCDGIWMTGGHMGFANTADMLVSPLAAGDIIISIKVTNCYFDGTNASINGLYFLDSVSDTGVNSKHLFTGCTFGLHKSTGTGVRLSARNLNDISFVGGNVSDNYGLGMLIEDGENISFSGVNFIKNNTAGASQGNIVIGGDAVGVTINGGQIGGNIYGAPDTDWGVNIKDTAGRITVKGTNFVQNTTDIVVTTTAKNLDLVDNVTDKGITVASAASLDVPQIGDVFNVTGTANITSIPAAASLRGRKIWLIFGGTLTVVKGNNLQMLAGNFSATTGAKLELVCDGTNWY